MPFYILDFQNRNLLMFKLLAVFAAALVLAYLSEQNTKATIAAGRRYSVWGDWAYIALVVVLTLFAGLRTSYNDTGMYMRSFSSAPAVSEFLGNPENLNPFRNPLYMLYRSALREITDNPQILIFTTSAFTQICFVRFIKRYSDNFTFSIFIYFGLGTFVFTLAALKQVVAMAIITLAFPYLTENKLVRYYLLMITAMLVHTYAIAFALLPLFRVRPWRAFTFLFIAMMAVIVMNFESVITSFLEQAEELGKSVSEEEVFADATINVFRLAVYSVAPIISLFFQKWILQDSSDVDHLLVHMSILSFAFMFMGTQAGANMFGRMGNYFELGTICCLPRMLSKTFNSRSNKLVTAIACVCFFGFFFYANAINLKFGQVYCSISLIDFIASIIH